MIGVDALLSWRLPRHPAAELAAEFPLDKIQYRVLGS